jgi:hypothetical protein
MNNSKALKGFFKDAERVLALPDSHASLQADVTKVKEDVAKVKADVAKVIPETAITGGVYEYTPEELSGAVEYLTGNIIANAAVAYNEIDISNVYSFTFPIGTAFSSNYGYAYLDANGNYLSGEKSSIVQTKTLVIPDNAKTLRVCWFHGTTQKFTIVYKNNLGGNTNLVGVNWCAFGDSLTAVNTLYNDPKGKRNYVDYVSCSLGLKATNCGYGGSGYIGTQVGHSFIDRIADIPTNTEILTVFGSFNDMNLTLGAMGDTTSATLYGAMYKFFTDVYTRCPNVVIGIITPTPWGTAHTGDNKTKCDNYVKALTDTAALFGIPVLDLYYNSNLRPWDSTFCSSWYRDDNNDGTSESVHPNDPCHKKFIAPKIEKFITDIYHIYK